MSWLTDEEVENAVRKLPKNQLSDDSFEKIRKALITMNGPVNHKKFKGVSWKTTTSMLSSAAAVAVVGFGILSYSNKHSGPSDASTVVAVNHTTGTEQSDNSSFRYTDYMSFTPMLPTNTEGATPHDVLMTVNHVQGDPMLQGGDVAQIFYKTTDGKTFTVAESSTSETKPDLSTVSSHSPVNATHFGNNQMLYTTEYVMPDGKKNKVAAYVANNVEYEVISSDSGFSLDQIENIAETLSAPCTAPPTFKRVFSPNLTEAQKIIHFEPKTASYVVPGFKVECYQSTWDSTTAGTPTEQLNTQYTSSNNASYTVYESVGENYGAEFASAQKLSIANQDVYQAKTGELMWVNPKTNVLFKVSEFSLPGQPSLSNEFTQVMQSIINDSTK